MASLQDQFLKAGLVDKNKAKLVQQDKSKQKKVERRTGNESIDESRLAALEVQRKRQNCCPGLSRIKSPSAMLHLWCW